MPPVPPDPVVTASAQLARGLLNLPLPVVRALAGRPAAEAPGLHPEALLLARLSRLVPDPEDFGDLAADRRQFELRAGVFGRGAAGGVTTAETSAGGRPARLYAPAGLPELAPLLIFFHGGGWLHGSLASHDGACRQLARVAGVRVLAVDYRLSPEHRFPAAADDATAAYADVAERPGAFGADPARIAVGGDSAGGNLAAVVCLDARERGLPQPAFQLLIYPGTDGSRKHPSVKRFADGFLLTEANIDRYKASYVPDTAQWGHPRFSPLLAADHSGLAPAHVATAAADPLLDEGEAYATKLRDAGVPVTLHRHEHLHGFFSLVATRSGREGLAAIAGALRQGLA